MSEFDVIVDGESLGFADLVAGASRELEGLGDEGLEGFLGRAGRACVVLGVRGVGVCTECQPEGSSHTDLMVEADALSPRGGGDAGVGS